MTQPFFVGISPDFKTDATDLLEPILTRMFDPLPHVDYDFIKMEGKVITPDEVSHCDALINLSAYVDPASFAGVSPAETRLAVIARWGVGYDMIDVPACTDADVLLAIQTDAVRKPVAEAILALFLALAKKLPAKDKLVRTGQWHLRPSTAGLGMSGKVIGSVGLGNIAREMFRMMQPFDAGRMLAADPYASAEQAATLGVELVDLPTLFRESDFIAVNCFLSDETRGMINADLFAQMKPTAYFVNTARGPIVNQPDLIAALEKGQFAGAGLDVFEEEPLDPASPHGKILTSMDNVILSPHGMAWTDDLYEGNGVGACESVLAILRGELSQYVVNRAVTEKPTFQAKLAGFKARWDALIA